MSRFAGKLNLKIPPVAQALLAVMLMWLLDRYFPLMQFRFGHQAEMGHVMVAIGVVIALSGVAVFIKSGTTVDPRHPDRADKLVIVGIYRFTRNPMYLGILMVLAGFALYFGSISVLAVPPLFVMLINRFQIVPEENALEEKFGRAYEVYCRQVRRWI